MDAWIARLKQAYGAGYYRTEPAEEEQSPFPWQSKVCRDCPFWVNSTCQVHAEYRSASAHTCSYFDPWNRERAQTILQERRWAGMRRWWE